jgi:hypothetical protein
MRIGALEIVDKGGSLAFPGAHLGAFFVIGGFGNLRFPEFAAVLRVAIDIRFAQAAAGDGRVGAR